MSRLAASIGVPMMVDKRQAKSKKQAIKGYRYSCERAHVRVEKEALKELPICTSCHMMHGDIKYLEYRGRVQIGEKRRAK